MNSITSLILAFVLLASVCLSFADPMPMGHYIRRRAILLEDPEEPLVRVRRDGYGYKGRVGPVYTFVKTDPYAHVKWGVRHNVGKKYAHGGAHH